MNDMEEIKGISGEAFEVCEAVIIRNALNIYLTHTAKSTPDHSDPDYKILMQLLTMLYKKYSQLAAQKVVIDESGLMVLRKDIRRDFDMN